MIKLRDAANSVNISNISVIYSARICYAESDIEISAKIRFQFVFVVREKRI